MQISGAHSRQVKGREGVGREKRRRRETMTSVGPQFEMVSYQGKYHDFHFIKEEVAYMEYDLSGVRSDFK